MNVQSPSSARPANHPAPDATRPSHASRLPILRPSLIIFFFMTLMTGVAYPLLTQGIGQTLFPEQARGSLIERDGHVLGSRLLGQSFSDPKYFWGRLSATSPAPYNASASGGSNFGPRNPALAQTATARINALRSVDPTNEAPIPVDLVTASGSGLDPHISPAAARFQALRVARVRGLHTDVVERMIDIHTTRPALAILGEPVVNVLTLNIALDDIQKNADAPVGSR